MSTKVIVFDFGNVIGHFDHQRAAQNLAKYTHIPADQLTGLLFEPWLEEDYEAGRLSTPEFLRHIRERAGFRGSDEELGIAFADMFWPNLEVCALVPHLQPHYRLLLGSNTNDLHSRQFRRQFADTLRHFHALVLSHEVGVRKPKAGFFEHCQRLADCASDECLFIDDVQANIAGAEACGWRAIHYRDFKDLQVRLAELGIMPGN